MCIDSRQGAHWAVLASLADRGRAPAAPWGLPDHGITESG